MVRMTDSAALAALDEAIRITDRKTNWMDSLKAAREHIASRLGLPVAPRFDLGGIGSVGLRDGEVAARLSPGKSTAPQPPAVEGGLLPEHAATLRTMIHQREDGEACTCAECRAIAAAIRRLTTPEQPGSAVQREAVAEIAGSDTVLGRESRFVRWEPGVDPFKLPLGGKLYLRQSTPSPAPAAEQGGREADRRRFDDPAFNDWLDQGISDCGHTVWHAIADVASAWEGWEAARALCRPEARGVEGLRQGNWHHPDGGRIVGWVIEPDDKDRMGADAFCLPCEIAESLTMLRDEHRASAPAAPVGVDEDVVMAVRHRVGCYEGMDITPAQVRAVLRHANIELALALAGKEGAK